MPCSRSVRFAVEYERDRSWFLSGWAEDLLPRDDFFCKVSPGLMMETMSVKTWKEARETLLESCVRSKK